MNEKFENQLKRRIKMVNKPHVNVKQIFQSIADKMLIDFYDIHSQINHRGERGRQWEFTLREFLSKYLPKKYAVGTGHVLDSNQNISGQCDIVIYDAFNCPIIFTSEEYQIFPVESVLGVIEVKSTLNSQRIKESISSIQKIKQLDRDEPILGCLFACRSSYKSELKIEAIATNWLKQSKKIAPDLRIDLGCILEDGLFQHYKGPPTKWGKDITDNTVMAFWDPEPTVLLLFFTFLFDALEERSSSKPFLPKYATGSGEIGLVKLLSLDEE